MRIIAIDPGYERLGVAILEIDAQKKERLLFSDCIQTDRKMPASARLFTLGQALTNILTEWQPTELAIETLFVSKNQKTAMLVAAARGIVLYLAEKEKLAVFEYSPLQVKSAITGYGKSDKQQVILMVQKLISVEKTIQFDDEYDAIAIGLTHNALAAQRLA